MSKNALKLGHKIKSTRKNLGISQKRLAEILGIQRVAVSQMENDERKISAIELKKLAEFFGTSTDSLLDLTKEPTIRLESPKLKKFIKPTIRINVPQKNVKKFKEVLLYILNKVGSKPNIGESVIYKLLYFIDFDFYEMYEAQLIGATYIKNKHGPTPLEFRKIISQMIKYELIEKVKSQYYQYPQTKYLPLKNAIPSNLSANEIEVINNVLRKISNMTAKQISDYSHKDVPWLTTDNGKVIEYESVFYRTPPYSVREYSEDI